MNGLGLTGAIASAVAAGGELRAGRASAALSHLFQARHRFGFQVRAIGESEATDLLRRELVALEIEAMRYVAKLEEARQ